MGNPLTLSLLLFCFLFTHSHAQTNTCLVGQKGFSLETTNVRAGLLTAGDMFWDPGLGLRRYEWPKGSHKHLIFGSALWFGGIDSASNQVITAVQTYRGDLRNFWPGPLSAGTAPVSSQAHCRFWDRFFPMSRSSYNLFRDALEIIPLPLPAAQIPEEVRFWPGKSNAFLKQQAQDSGLVDLSAFDQDLAPFVDVNANGVYDPQWGDYPDLGQKSSMVWWVMNDAGNRKNYPDNSGLIPPAHLEFQALAYGYPRINNLYFLDNTLFVDWKIINRGQKKLKSSYLSAWIDPDIGNHNDDYLGCHPLKNLGFAYNNDTLDEGQNGYGTKPPALGFKILDAPGPVADQDGHDNNRNGVADEPGEKAINTGFFFRWIWNNSEGPPPSNIHFYRFQQSLFRDGTPVTFGGYGFAPVSAQNPVTRFMFPGENDPFGLSLGGTVSNPIPPPFTWTDQTSDNGSPDRRFLINSGPFDFSPGQSVSYRYAILIGHGFSASQNVNQLYATSDSLEQFLPLITSTSEPLRSPGQKIRLFPNPTRDRVWIETPEDGTTLEIYSLNGVKIRSQFLPSRKESVSIRGLRPGLYALRVQGRGGMEVVKLAVE